MKSLLFLPLFLISFNYCFSSTIGNTEKETNQLNCNKYEKLFSVEKIKQVIDEKVFMSNNQMLKTSLYAQNENLLLNIKAIREYITIDPALKQEFDKLTESDY